MNKRPLAYTEAKSLLTAFYMQACDTPATPQKDMETFCRYLDSSERVLGAESLQPWANHRLVIATIATTMREYTAWEICYLDTVAYWSSFTLLCIAGTPEASATIEHITDHMIAADSHHLYDVRRSLASHYQPCLYPAAQKLSDYIEQHNGKLPPHDHTTCRYYNTLAWAKESLGYAPAEIPDHVRFNFDKLYTILVEESTDAPTATQAAMSQYCKKLATFVHAPGTPAQASRIKPWAGDASLVEIVARILPRYTNWDGKSLCFDTISYWYSVALLTYSNHPATQTTLAYIADFLLGTRHANADLLLRNFRIIPNPHHAALAQKVAAHFEILTTQSDATQWAADIGLEVPSDDWNVSIKLTQDGEIKYAFQLPSEEFDARLTLDISIHNPPEGDGRSWSIRLNNRRNTTRGDWPAPHPSNILIADVKHTLPQSVSPANLAATLRQIENLLGTRFARKIASSHFSKGIKNKKAADAWIASLPM